ncbi:CopG family transcriptional regulator [Desulfosarcina sp. OttesenSCG-928-G10]|nr:CopG family transcriptional regulator [Desulfosarcina sp. OttesenSCG-928-G10]
MLTIQLPADIEKRLDILVAATQRPKSFYVCEALSRSLEDIEDAYLAEAAYEQFSASGEKGIPLEEVESRLGLAN